MTMVALKARTKNLLKKSRFIARTYDFYLFLNITSVKDIIHLVKNIGRLKLIFKVRYYSQVSYRRLFKLHELASNFERRKTGGSFVECGVRNGGSAAVIAAAARKNKKRHVWLFDSWEGLPEPEERDIAGNPEEAKKGLGLGYEEKVKEIIFIRLELDNTRIHLVKGWFIDTLQRSAIGKIALLHLDCDLYQSVKYCLETLYDDVIEGGCIVIDDYGFWVGCKKAVDEFIENRNLKVKLVKVDAQGVYFVKKSVDSSKPVKSTI
jgi:O-methyltransferase